MDRLSLTSIFSKENATNLINIFLVILIAGAGYWFYTKNSGKQSEKQSNSMASVTGQTKPPEATKLFVVDISGAVKKPGVYELDSNSRIIDVIEKAGGFTDTADMKAIEKNINKAQKISDGQKIYFPDISDNLVNNAASGSTTSQVTSGPVSINNSSRESLIALPEIGEKTADKIIANRPYFELADLVKKGCLKQTQLDKIKELISI